MFEVEAFEGPSLKPPNACFGKEAKIFVKMGQGLNAVFFGNSSARLAKGLGRLGHASLNFYECWMGEVCEVAWPLGRRLKVTGQWGCATRGSERPAIG